MTGSNDTGEFLRTLCIQFLDLVKDTEWVFRVTTQMSDGVFEGLTTKRGTMSLTVALIGGVIFLACSLTHDAFANDECGTLFFLKGLVKSLAYFVGIVAIDVDDIPIP